MGGSGNRIRTGGLLLMRQMSYHCSIPQRLVGTERFERSTTRSQGECSDLAELSPDNGTAGRNRTYIPGFGGQLRPSPQPYTSQLTPKPTGIPRY